MAAWQCLTMSPRCVDAGSCTSALTAAAVLAVATLAPLACDLCAALQMALDDLRVVQHAHSSDITAMAFSYELSQIVTGDRHGELRAWDFQDLKLVSAPLT